MIRLSLLWGFVGRSSSPATAQILVVFRRLKVQSINGSQFNYQLYIRIYRQQYIQQCIQLPSRTEYTAGYAAVYWNTSQSPTYSWLFKSLFNYQLYIHSQQYTHRITSQIRIHSLFKFLAVNWITRQSPMYSWLFSSIFYYQPEPNT